VIFRYCRLPLPLKVTTCGLLVALSWSGKLPVRFPMAVGLKTMLTVHVPCAAKPAPQVLVSAKSPATGIALNVTIASPSLITFKILGGLAVPTF
jgi:hypothetical protein